MDVLPQMAWIVALDFWPQVAQVSIVILIFWPQLAQKIIVRVYLAPDGVNAGLDCSDFELLAPDGVDFEFNWLE